MVLKGYKLPYLQNNFGGKIKKNLCFRVVSARNVVEVSEKDLHKPASEAAK